jgi:hypothetical protein
MEVTAGLEPAKAGFADQRLDRFGIATKSIQTCTKLCANPSELVPDFTPKAVPKIPS